MRYFVSFLVLLITLSHATISAEDDISQLYMHSDNEMDFLSLRAGKAYSTTTGTNLLAMVQLDVEMHFEYMPLNRSRTFMDRKQPVCVIDKLKTAEREQQHLFSLPVNIFINRRLYQLTDSAPLKQNEVYLPSVFSADSNKKLLLTNQIAYETSIWEQIRQIPQHNKVFRNAAAHEKGLMAMLTMKRAEYALFFPQQLTDVDVTFSARSYKIKEVTPYVLGHIMCAKTPGMASVIAQLNNNLTTALRNGTLYQQHVKYLNRELITEFDNYFEEVKNQYYP